MRRRRPERVPVTDRSLALFRLGEACNNDCPMCSNSGRPEAFFIKTPELLRRAEFLAAQRFPAVVLTGGEPTIHPGFWDVVARLGELGVRWDINTHARSFADRAFMERAVSADIRRAIASFHSHDVAASCAIFGVSERGHHETVDGIKALLAAGIPTMLNTVLTRLTLGRLEEHLAWCLDHFPSGWALKLVFPSTAGKGGGWDGIGLRYDEVMAEVWRVRDQAAAAGIKVVFESFPSCVLRDPDNSNASRSGFGETHYLEDVAGTELYSIQHIEAWFSAYPETCRPCAALSRCPGVAESYLRQHGVDELHPFIDPVKGDS